ncbi:MAG: hypothetical protein AAGJ08_03785 [Cyanobacteria bacterium P01_H01_bin.35]
MSEIASQENEKYFNQKFWLNPKQQKLAKLFLALVIWAMIFISVETGESIIPIPMH